MAVDSPTNYPDWKHPDYQYMQPILSRLLDVYEDVYGRKDRYILKAGKEPQPAYDLRVQRAEFNNYLRPLIDATSGLLTAFEVTDMPSTVAERENNLDGQGSDFKSFFQEADKLAERDFYCFVLADAPEAATEERTVADTMVDPRYPYLVLIDRRNVPNWKFHYENGAIVLDQVSVLFQEQEEDGAFGSAVEPTYHVFRRLENGVERQKWRQDKSQQSHGITKWAKFGEPQVNPNLKRIPIECYPWTKEAFSKTIPPFYKIAALNIKLFRKESALDEIEYRVNAPTAWRKGPTDIRSRPPIIFGGTWVIELTDEEEVGVLEISGSGIDSLRQTCDALKQDILKEGIGFLSGQPETQRTATEVYLSSAQASSSINGYARAKASAIQRIFDHWTTYTGEENTLQVQADHNLLEMPLDAQEMGQLLSQWQAGALSLQTYLELLRMGKQLSPDFDVDEELRRIESEKQREKAANSLPPVEQDGQPPAVIDFNQPDEVAA